MPRRSSERQPLLSPGGLPGWEGDGVIQAREIEVKYRVSDAADMELALATHGLVLSTPVHQDDQAYAPCG